MDVVVDPVLSDKMRPHQKEGVKVRFHLSLSRSTSELLAPRSPTSLPLLCLPRFSSSCTSASWLFERSKALVRFSPTRCSSSPLFFSLAWFSHLTLFFDLVGDSERLFKPSLSSGPFSSSLPTLDLIIRACTCSSLFPSSVASLGLTAVIRVFPFRDAFQHRESSHRLSC